MPENEFSQGHQQEQMEVDVQEGSAGGQHQEANTTLSSRAPTPEPAMKAPRTSGENLFTKTIK